MHSLGLFFSARLGGSEAGARMNDLNGITGPRRIERGGRSVIEWGCYKQGGEPVEEREAEWGCYKKGGEPLEEREAQAGPTAKFLVWFWF